MTTRSLYLIVAAALISMLQACGGSSSSSGPGNVRLLNVSDQFAALDFYAGTSLLSPAVAQDSVSSYSNLGSGSYIFNLNSAGSGTTSASEALGVSPGGFSTIVAYSSAGRLNLAQLDDTQPAPSAGAAWLRVVNASAEAGTLDVYITDSATPLTSVPATFVAAAAGRSSGYDQIGAGTYRVRVTATGDATDVRLDLPAVTLADQQVATLVLSHTPGGVLVNGLLLTQAGSALPYKNPFARMRLVASASSGAAVSATANSTLVAAGLVSPTIGAYSLVPAGPLTMNVQIGSTVVPAPGLSAIAGSDLTLLVMGSAASPQIALLNDDNNPSTSTTNPVRLRLVHALNGLNGNMTLTDNFTEVASNIAPGAVSSTIDVAATSGTRLEVTSPVFTGPLFLKSGLDAPTLQAGKVYTVFVLGDVAAPVGTLNQSR